MRLLLIGRPTAWLAPLGRGFAAQRPDWDVWTRPFGPGPSFVDACPPVYDPVDPTPDAVRSAWAQSRTPIFEGDASGGPADGGMALVEQLDVADVRRGGLIMAASTRAPLVGAGAPATSSAIVAFYANRTVPGELLADPVPITRRPGSGALGGVGAAVLALGGELHDTGAWLRRATELDDDMDGTDLVIAVEPALHHSTLAESTLDAIADAARPHALPTVVVTAESTLSRHELAEWGIHGSKVVRGTDDEALEAAGRALARTWAP